MAGLRTSVARVTRIPTSVTSSSPDPAAPARVSDYTAFFTIENEGEPGRLIETGPTARIFASPRNPRTEAYVSGRFG